MSELGKPQIPRRSLRSARDDRMRVAAVVLGRTTSIRITNRQRLPSPQALLKRRYFRKLTNVLGAVHSLREAQCLTVTGSEIATGVVLFERSRITADALERRLRAAGQSAAIAGNREMALATDNWLLATESC